MSLVVIVVAPTEAMIQTIIVLKATDYGKALDSIGPETFSYIDPPYPPLNDTAYFTHYTALRFGSSEELRVDRNASSGDIVLQALIAVDRGPYRETICRWTFEGLELEAGPALRDELP